MMLFNVGFVRKAGAGVGLLSLLMMSGLGSARAQVPTAEGTMPEDYLPGLKTILQTAMKQAPLMVLRQIEVVQADANRIAANASLYPNVGGSGSYSWAESSPSSNPANKSVSSGLYYNIGFSQTLFQFGAVKNQAAIAKIGLLIAEKNQAEAFRLLAVAIRQQYLFLIVKKGGLIGLNYRTKSAEAALQVEEERLRAGTIAPGEIIDPRLRLAEARLNVARAEQDYAFSRQVLAHLAGYPDLADNEIPADVVKPNYSTEKAAALKALLLRDNAENTNLAQVALLNIRSAELSYKIARVRQLPKFSLGANKNVSSTNSVVGGTVSTDAVDTQSFGITGTWSLFDGFATKAEKIRTQASKRFYEKTLQNQIQLTLDTAQNLEKVLAINAQGLELTEQRAQLAEGAMNQMKNDFQINRATQSAVDEATSNHLLFQNILATARAEFFVRWAEYVSVIGVDPAVTNLSLSHGR